MCGNEKEPEKTSLRAGEYSKPTKRAKELSRHKYFTINVYQEDGEVYIEGERADEIVLKGILKDIIFHLNGRRRKHEQYY